MIVRASLALTLAAAVALPSAAHAASPDADSSPRCGAPPSGASWFYLGDPAGARNAVAAHRVYRAVMDAFDGILAHDPACLRVEVLDPDALRSRSRALDEHHGIDDNVVGFQSTKLGADNTVYVMPRAGQGVEVVMLHEVLHALSHRFSSEIRGRRLEHPQRGRDRVPHPGARRRVARHPEARLPHGLRAVPRFYDVLVPSWARTACRCSGRPTSSMDTTSSSARSTARLGVSLREAGRLLVSGDAQWRAEDNRCPRGIVDSDGRWMVPSTQSAQRQRDVHVPALHVARVVMVGVMPAQPADEAPAPDEAVVGQMIREVQPLVQRACRTSMSR